MQDFRRLTVWQKAHALSVRADSLADSIRRRRPSLGTQMERAAGSIAANIAEGCGASTNPEFARFLTVSIRSANEYENHLERARGSRFISIQDYESHVAATIEVRRMLIGLRKAVLGKGKNGSDPDVR